MPIPRVSFQFTDEQWGAIRSVRKSWPDDIDWVLARDTMERLGRMFLMVRAQRSHLGSPVKIRDRLRTALRLIRELQAAMNALPVRFAEAAQILILKSRIGGYKACLFATSILPDRSFVAAKTHIAIGLSLVSLRSGLICLTEILSFSRKLDGTPHGPLVEFLTLTLAAITGSAPGPDGIAKIIDQVQKTKAVLPVLNHGARLIFQLPRVLPVLQSVPDSHMEPEDKAWRAPKLPVASRSRRSRSRRRL